MLAIDELNKIKKASIVALVSDEYLMDKLVLKGGTCLEFAYKLHHRASKDIDFSIEDEFSPVALKELSEKIRLQFLKQFSLINYHAFDVEIRNKPVKLPDNIKMSGYELMFKLIPSALYNEIGDNIEALRNRAVPLGDGDKKAFIIEISKFEYVKNRELKEIEGHKLYVYSPLLIICEKLRALCQKMKEYRGKAEDVDLPRARDFYDIYVVNENLVNVDFKDVNNREVLRQVFQAKDVNLNLLTLLKDKRKIHEDDFRSVLQADLRQKGRPEIFDYYFEYTLNLIADLEEFWVK